MQFILFFKFFDKKTPNMKRLICFHVISIIALAYMNAQPEEPILRLNSAFHTAAIRSISIDAQGYRLLTVSEDKTARLWDARTGNSTRILRPPIGYGVEGNLYACALSPRGNIAAVSGSTGGTWNKADSSKVVIGSWSGYARHLKYSIYLFSTQTGELQLNIDNLESEVQDLCFSPDGEQIAVGLTDNKGVRIIKADDGAEIRKLIGYGGSVREMAFSSSGQFVTVADDGYLRFYNKSYQLINTLAVDGKPASVVFSHDGSKIAVGCSGIINIFQIEGNNLKKTSLPIPAKAITDAVTYSADEILYSGEYGQDGKNRIVAWKDGKRTEIPAGAGRVSGIKPLSDGSIVYATSYPEMGRILSNNKAPGEWVGNIDKAYLRTADMVALSQRQQEVFQLNDEGFEVGLIDVKNEVLFFSLIDRELKTAPSAFPKAANRNLTYALTVEKWKDSYEVVLNGKTLQILDKDEINRCVDISADGKHILLGTDRHLLCLDKQGKVIWKQNLTEESIAIKISGNGKTAVIALNNGTYAWYDMTEGVRVLNLFVHPDHRRWILWTPRGHYDCSVGAEDLIGWNMNQGKDKASAFFPVAQFRSVFYRPSIVDQTLGIDMEKYAQNKQPELNEIEVEQVVFNLPPEINIVSPQSESTSDNQQVRLQYSVITNSDKPLESIKVLVDGRPVQLLPSIKQGINEVVVEIPEKDSEISIIAKNENASSVPASVRIKWTGKSKTDILKPKLYVLAVGVSSYKDKSLSLQFAAKDANDFANIMAKQKGMLYSDVELKLLTDDKSSKNNILDGLDWIQSETTSHDVAMIFFAGHGMNDNTGNFFYMPVEADPNRLRATCVNYAEITQSVSAIAGKVVLFMDACHSGGVMGASKRSAAADIIGFVNELASAENGVIVFTSSTGRQYSLEDPVWNNGAFTKALVEGLGGDADLYKNNSITIKSLDFYIAQRVKELTKGAQSPTTIVPASISDFPIALR